MREKKKEVTTISQRAAQIVEGAHTKDVACPRCDRELHVFNTASGPILRCRGWSLAGTPCTLIKACHNGGRRPWRVEAYQPYRRWNFSEWFWWPRNTPKTRRWHTGSTSYKRLDGPGASSSGKPSFGTGTVRSVATSASTVSASSISTAARGVVDNGSWQVLPEDGESTGDRWSRDTGTDRIGVQSPNPTQRQSQKA